MEENTFTRNGSLTLFIAQSLALVFNILKRSALICADRREIDIFPSDPTTSN
jgi:hypothetical protein